MKKILSSLVLMAFFSMNVSAFSDVESYNIYFDAINYIENEGIVDGYEDGTFKPIDRINRVEFLKIVIEAFYGSDELVDDCELEFPDVDIDAWYGSYLCFAVNKGIIDGYNDGTFGPDNNVNFVEAAKIIVVASGLYYPSAESPFYVDNEVNGFIEDYPNWYHPYVETLEYEKASPDSIESLDDEITRGQMAEMIYRLKNGITDKDATNFLISYNLWDVGNKIRVMNDLVDEYGLNDVVYTGEGSKWRIFKIIENDFMYREVVVFGVDDLWGTYSRPLGIFVMKDGEFAGGFHFAFNDTEYKNFATKEGEYTETGRIDIIKAFSDIEWLNHNEISYKIHGYWYMDCIGMDTCPVKTNSYKILVDENDDFSQYDIFYTLLEDVSGAYTPDTINISFSIPAEYSDYNAFSYDSGVLFAESSDPVEVSNAAVGDGASAFMSAWVSSYEDFHEVENFEDLVEEYRSFSADPEVSEVTINGNNFTRITEQSFGSTILVHYLIEHKGLAYIFSSVEKEEDVLRGIMESVEFL